LKYTDLVLLDIKSVNPETFKQVTSVPIENTLKFARHLSDEGIPIWARFVLVPNLTDDADDMRKLAEFLTTLSNVEMVGVLPFHQMGAYKWEELGFEYQLKDTRTPTVEEAERVREMFREFGFVVR